MSVAGVEEENKTIRLNTENDQDSHCIASAYTLERHNCRIDYITVQNLP